MRKFLCALLLALAVFVITGDAEHFKDGKLLLNHEVPVQEEQVTTGIEPARKEPLPDVICTHTMGNRNISLSKTIKVPATTCSNVGQGLLMAAEARVSEAIATRAAYLRHTQLPDESRTIGCNVSAFGRNLPGIPLMTSEQECLQWQIYINYVLEEAAYYHLDTIRRVIGLSDDRQSATSVSSKTCAVGIYDLQIRHWNAVDCGVAQRLFSRCQSKRGKKQELESAPDCFMEAFADVEARFVVTEE